MKQRHLRYAIAAQVVMMIMMTMLMSSVWTAKDVYIITSMAIVIMVCVWHAIVPAIYFAKGREMADAADTVVALALGTAYIIAHVIFACVIATRVGIDLSPFCPNCQ